jgi:hypothetical protein
MNCWAAFEMFRRDWGGYGARGAKETRLGIPQAEKDVPDGAG